MKEDVKKHVEKEFLKIYDRYFDAIFRHCYFRVFDRELAKDLTQETFMKLWDYVCKGNTVENTQAFLYKTATNIIIDLKRKKKEQSLEALEADGFQPHTTHNEVDVLHTRLEVQKLMKIINLLEEEYREPFLLRFIEELKPKEIAEMLGESVNVISVRITRAKQQVHTLMKDNT